MQRSFSQIARRLKNIFNDGENKEKVNFVCLYIYKMINAN